MLTIILPDGRLLGGDQNMSMELPKPIHTKEQHEASLRAEQLDVDHAADLRRQHVEMKQREATHGVSLGPANFTDSRNQPPARTVPVVWAELQHAQEQAARVKPLREELDKLLGRKTRARKAAP